MHPSPTLYGRLHKEVKPSREAETDAEEMHKRMLRAIVWWNMRMSTLRYNVGAV
jgi:hypothetical protein